MAVPVAYHHALAINQSVHSVHLTVLSREQLGAVCTGALISFYSETKLSMRRS